MTPAQMRELRTIARTGEPSDLYEWHRAPGALAFYARDKVLGALIRRGLITDQDIHGSYALTEKGKAAL